MSKNLKKMRIRQNVYNDSKKEHIIMKAKLGIAPIAWSNDDLPELGGETTLETCLTESKYTGTTSV